VLGLGTAWALLRRPWLGFAGAWFFLILAPTSSFVPIRDLAFEHRMYLPLAAVVVAVVMVVHWLVALCWARFGTRPGALREVSACLLAVVTVALGLRTLVRNLDYRTPVAMWTSVVKVRPQHARGHQNLGFELSNLGQSEPAIEQFRQAVDLDPGFTEAQHCLGRELAVAGQPAQSIPYLQEAVRLDPNHDRAQTNLGIALAELGRLDEAVSHYRRALEIKPRSAGTYYALGAALLRQQKVPEAMRAFEEALRINPRQRQARQVLDSIRSAQTQPAPPDAPIP
jgi:tetratricopeptide (TPR) repeat protein